MATLFGLFNGSKVAVLVVSVVVGVVAALPTSSAVSSKGLHHLVGGDQGWDAAADVGSWASGRTFRVGDSIWFAYSTAVDSIVELRSREEFDACDVENPIKMYASGLDRVGLEGEGARYFVSGELANCKRGLKLHVDVRPGAGKEAEMPVFLTQGVADGPQPSGSACNGGSFVFWVGLLFGLLCVGF